MTSKIERLNQLVGLAPSLSLPTITDPRVLDASQHQGPWYVRSEDDFSRPRIVTKHQARQLLIADHGVSLAVQPLIEALTSGAALMAGEATIVEQVHGSSGPLFRGGAPGHLTGLLAFSGAIFQSVTGDQVLEDTARVMLEVCGQLPLHSTAVVEWIRAADGTVWLVDLKYLPELAVHWNGDHTRPVLSSQANTLNADVVLASTELALIDNIKSGSLVLFQSGAFLSHATLRLVASGCKVSVRVAPFKRGMK